MVLVCFSCQAIWFHPNHQNSHNNGQVWFHTIKMEEWQTLYISYEIAWKQSISVNKGGLYMLVPPHQGMMIQYTYIRR